MDDADRTDQNIENAIQNGIDQARRAPVLLPKGSCWYCEAPVDKVRRFCDLQCVADFEVEEEAIKRAGNR